MISPFLRGVPEGGGVSSCFLTSPVQQTLATFDL